MGLEKRPRQASIGSRVVLARDHDSRGDVHGDEPEMTLKRLNTRGMALLCGCMVTEIGFFVATT